MIDPVEMRAKQEDLNPEQRAEVAKYLREAFERVLQKGGCQVVSQPGMGVARVRLALTEVNDTKWYLNLHPATKATGAGMGSAAMEGEIVDSVTGEQLAAVIQVNHASQFRLSVFSTINDVKNVIDHWAKAAGERLKELRSAK